MFRLTMTASALALAASAAFAQEDGAATVDVDATAKAANEIAVDAAEETGVKATILQASSVSTKDDAKLFAEAEFVQADLNNDGQVDKMEFLAYAAVRAPLETADPETDTQVTAEAEVEAQGDADPDMKSVTEPATASAEMIAEEIPQTAEEQFAKISKGDETITQDEIVEARLAQFDAADADDDETLSEEERASFETLTELKPSAGVDL